MPGAALIWDLVARDQASRALRQVADAADRTALATSRASDQIDELNRKMDKLNATTAANGKGGLAAIAPAAVLAAPAIVTLTGAVGAAGAAFGVLGGVAALAGKDIATAMKNNTPMGIRLKASVDGLKKSYQELGKTAAHDVLPGITKALAVVQNRMPSIDRVVGQAAGTWNKMLPAIASTATGLLRDLEPAFKVVDAALVSFVRHAAAWANSAGGRNFGLMLAKDFQSALPLIKNLLSVVGKLFTYWNGPEGQASLRFLGTLSGYLNKIPANVLGPLAEGAGLLSIKLGGLSIAARAAKWIAGLSVAKSAVGWFKGLGGAIGSFVGNIGSRLLSPLQTLWLKIQYLPTAVKGLGSALGGAAIGFGIGMFTRNMSTGAKAVGALASAAGGAAMGFAIGGPWGAAIGGAAGLVSNLATDLFGASKATLQLNADTKTFAQTLEQTNGIINKSVRDKVASMLQDKGLLVLIQQAGFQGNQIVSDIVKGGRALQPIIDQLSQVAAERHKIFVPGRYGAHVEWVPTAAARKAQNLKDALLEVNKAFGTGRANAQRLIDSTKKVTDASSSAASAVNLETLAEQRNIAAVQKRIAALQKLQATEIAQKQGEDAYKLGVDQLSQSVVKNNRSLSDNTKAGLTNRQALEQLIAQNQGLEGSFKHWQPVVARNSQLLIDEATKLGFNRREVVALLRWMHMLPKQVLTDYKLLGFDKAKAQLGTIGKLITNDSGYHVATVVVQTTGGGSYAHGNTAAGRHHRRGGMIHGAGSGTSDSIPAMLSNGEYVVNARQTRKHLGLLHAINRGIRGFAGGGLVGLASTYRDWNPQIAAAIAMAESGGNAHSHNYNPSTGDDSYGLWQINMLGAMGPARRREFGIRNNAALYNPSVNVRAAHDIWRQSGFGAWTAYNTGAYQQYLGAAGGITGTGGGGGGGGGSSAAQQRSKAHTAMSNLVGGINSWRGSLGSVSSERQAFHTLIGDVRQAGGSARLIEQLRDENVHLENAIRRRLADAARLAKAQAALKNAYQIRSQDISSFKSAGKGFFDITNATGSAGSILAQEKQAITRLHQWVSDFHKIIPIFGKSPAGRAMLRQLAAAGLASAGTVHALATAGPALDRKILAEQAQINRISDNFGSYLGHYIDDPRIQHDRAWVEHRRDVLERDRRRVHRDEMRIERAIARGVNHALVAGLAGVTLKIDARGVVSLYHAGVKQNAHTKRHVKGAQVS